MYNEGLAKVSARCCLHPTLASSVCCLSHSPCLQVCSAPGFVHESNTNFMMVILIQSLDSCIGKLHNLFSSLSI